MTPHNDSGMLENVQASQQITLFKL